MNNHQQSSDSDIQLIEQALNSLQIVDSDQSRENIHQELVKNSLYLAEQSFIPLCNGIKFYFEADPPLDQTEAFSHKRNQDLHLYLSTLLRWMQNRIILPENVYQTIGIFPEIMTSLLVNRFTHDIILDTLGLFQFFIIADSPRSTRMFLECNFFQTLCFLISSEENMYVQSPAVATLHVTLGHIRYLSSDQENEAQAESSTLYTNILAVLQLAGIEDILQTLLHCEREIHSCLLPGTSFTCPANSEKEGQ
ncbi:hypothetical protein BLNAU_16522 [Blattamonas nauphoetae]|uniref:Uncharacterized protein n=1 Tax=Blattamonas nauphoetae TaxID=2049346 RepID=A0ABQ9XDZ9_9EUKA|nr:hypothetical protein BLNAU_16522 [Blattamonas nauphoetae]